MNDIKTVEKSHPSNTGPDLESQTLHDAHSQQPQIRRETEKDHNNIDEERMREGLMQCREGQVYQRKCG